MKAFAKLYAALDATTRTNEKVDALTGYFRGAAAEAAWAITFLIGRRIKRLIESRKLAEWAIAESGNPEWIFKRVLPRRQATRRNHRPAAAARTAIERPAPALLDRRTLAAPARRR